jgi:acetyltransferase-like isoleucine patch superfamily enzyme
VHPRTLISNNQNIEFDMNNLNIFQTPGCYWQNHKAKIIIGKGCYIAPNVGIITTNHDLYNFDKHTDGKEIVIGDNCWIGMISIILPGVILEIIR